MVLEILALNFNFIVIYFLCLFPCPPPHDKKGKQGFCMNILGLNSKGIKIRKTEVNIYI